MIGSRVASLKSFSVAGFQDATSTLRGPLKLIAMALVVPSDITILENKMSIGRRRLRLLEGVGLFLTAPMLHLHYSKIDKADMQAVLSKKYDPEDKSEPAVVCKKRQEAIRKSVVSNTCMWGIAGGAAMMNIWSFRRYLGYNYKTNGVIYCLATPFIFYGMSWVGRYAGDIATGRNAEYGRDRFLASLPGKTYYSASD